MLLTCVWRQDLEAEADLGASSTQPLRGQVEIAFSDSIRVIWICMIGICAAGFACSLMIRALPLGTMTDEQWGLAERHGKQTSVDEKLV